MQCKRKSLDQYMATSRKKIIIVTRKMSHSIQTIGSVLHSMHAQHIHHIGDIKFHLKCQKRYESEGERKQNESHDSRTCVLSKKKQTYQAHYRAETVNIHPQEGSLRPLPHRRGSDSEEYCPEDNSETMKILKIFPNL